MGTPRAQQTSPYLILLALWLMMFSTSSQLIIMVPILPEIGATLGVNQFWRGMLLTSYAVALAGSALLVGPASDRIGRRRVLLLGTGLMTVTLALHTVAADYELLLIMRILAGIGGGMLSGGSVAYIGDYFPYEQRGWANGWVMSGTALGQVAGVPLGKVLATAFGYRWPFLGFALTMAGATVLIWRYVPSPEADLDPERVTFRRGIRKYRRVLNDATARAAVGSYVLMFFGFGLLTTFLPTWLETSIGLSSYEVALLFAIGGLGNILAAPSAGRLSDTIGRKPIIVWTSALLGVIMLVTPYMVSGFYSVAVLFFGAMATVGMRIGPLQSLLTALVPDRQRGLLMGLAVGAGQGGFGFGSFVAGLTFGPLGYVSNAIGAACSAFAMALLVQQRLPEPAMDQAASRA